MSNSGRVTINIKNDIGYISFFHPKGNSLPGALLKKITAEITAIGLKESAKVIVLQSEGSGAFCAGASFSELQAVTDIDSSEEFFLGFSKVILAMKNCPKFIIARVHGKAVGGGVGLIAAADYAFAINTASVKLSELALGIGPFVIGPSVEKKIGFSAFSALSIDSKWRDAHWCLDKGLYTKVLNTVDKLDEEVAELAKKLAESSSEAMAELKSTFWYDTRNWEELLPKRAKISAQLLLSDFSKKLISSFKT